MLKDEKSEFEVDRVPGGFEIEVVASVGGGEDVVSGCCLEVGLVDDSDVLEQSDDFAKSAMRSAVVAEEETEYMSAFLNSQARQQHGIHGSDSFALLDGLSECGGERRSDRGGL